MKKQELSYQNGNEVKRKGKGKKEMLCVCNYKLCRQQ